MKRKQYILTVLVGVVMLLTGGILGYRLGTVRERAEAAGFDHSAGMQVKRETRIDTVTARAPKPQMALTTGSRFYTLPIYRYIAGGSGGELRKVEAAGFDHSSDTTSASASALLKRDEYGTGAGGKPRLCDSAIVELPTIQRHYADSTYDAWVSGPIDPKLDSLRVYARTEIITKRERWPPKHWHIGPTVGFGYTPQGFQPYIGISLTYSIFSF